MPPSGVTGQGSEIFGLLADENAEGVIFTWADPLALGSAPVTLSRLTAGETSGIRTARRVKL